MKKMWKKLLTSLLTLALTLSFCIPSSAAETGSIADNSEVAAIEETNGNVTPDGEMIEFTTENKQKIPNVIFGAITPQKNGFKFTVTNLGIDTVDSITLNWKLYDDIKGTYLTGSSKTFTNVRPGNKSYTWTKAKSATVQERIDVTGSARDGKDYMTIKKASTVRWNFVGGKYGTMSAYGGQRHHMPSNSVSPLSTDKGPCIRMLTQDHKKTSSYGSSTSAKNFRDKEKKQIQAGKFLGAQKLGINDVNSLFGSIKYSVAISEMVSYTKGLGYTK